MENIINIKGLKIYQDNNLQSVTVDSVLLADFVKVNAKFKKVLDIGSGNGIIALLLAQKSKTSIEAVEIQKEAYELSLKNIKVNELDVVAYNQDIRDYVVDKFQVYDVVVSNPPYFEIEDLEIQMKDSVNKRIARNEYTLNIEEIIRISNRILKNNGHLYLIFRAVDMYKVFSYFNNTALRPSNISLVYTNLDKEAQFCLLDAIKSKKAKLHIDSPRILYKKGKKTDYLINLYGENNEKK